MEIRSDGYQLSFSNEPDYIVGSKDNPRTYVRHYHFDQEYQPHSHHGIVCLDQHGTRNSCLLSASAGASGIHEHSAIVVKEKCLAAVGNWLCCLTLPALDLNWAAAVDEATCFGVYYSEPFDCLISHGELEISRVDFEGNILWKESGKDIFTGKLWFDKRFVFVTDFNDEVYRIDITTGKSEIITL